uniref:Enoyl reductase (ER) domain-containing protein n=1 Tax=Lotharella oceanica TaxID=641309 RepID=A0A7S2TFQ0_9EUKA|mmetsp:Transcript_12000/g.23110  ORF Transcript_12000/g.23110 Transcript_12000/m.23110 type:complete len:390 (+) Transcript_12000:72-1241(+)
MLPIVASVGLLVCASESSASKSCCQPNVMTAAYYERHGGEETWSLSTEYPIPKRKPGSVLIRIMASGLNPVDYKMCLGDFPSFVAGPKPKIFGADLAGVVVKTGVDSKFQKGDSVFGMKDFQFTPWGTLCEYAAVPESQLALMPKGISFAQAATLPLVSLTTLQAFRSGGITETKRAEMKGKSILIHAGSGGVGNTAIQIAKYFGLRVTTTCSASNRDYVQGLGADKVIDYATQDFEAELRDDPQDFVLDVLGGRVESKSERVLRDAPNSTYMTILNTDMVKHYESWGVLKHLGFFLWTFGHYSRKLGSQLLMKRKYTVTAVAPNGEDMEYVRRLVEEGHLKPQLSKTYDLKDFRSALRAIATGHTRGKIAIEIGAGELGEKGKTCPMQ